MTVHRQVALARMPQEGEQSERTQGLVVVYVLVPFDPTESRQGGLECVA